jgi:hypothetical protein
MSIVINSSLPQASYNVGEAIPLRGVDSLEQILRELYETISSQDTKASSHLHFAISCQRAWQDSLTKQLEETQAKLYSALSSKEKTTKLSNIIAPLCVSVEGFIACISEGSFIHGGAAIALGGLLALDALLDNPGKKFLAECLAKSTDTPQAKWFEHIGLTCALAISAMAVSLPGKEAVQLASDISKGSLEIVETGYHYASERQEALLLEIRHSWDVSERNTHNFSNNMESTQSGPHDQLKLLTQLYRSNTATITDMFT